MGWPVHRPVGLTHLDLGRAFAGFTLVCPAGGGVAVLLDLEGRAVHLWRAPEGVNFFNVELLGNGNLLALCAPPAALPAAGEAAPSQEAMLRLEAPDPPELFRRLGGGGSLLVELDWDGGEVWRFEDEALHHDFARLEDGRTLALEWVEIDEEVARTVRGGTRWRRQPMPRRMIGDDIVAISAEGEIVERIELWRLLDPGRARICPLERRWEWTHCNALDVLPDGGIIFSARNVSTIGIVDAGGGTGSSSGNDKNKRGDSSGSGADGGGGDGEGASLRWQWGWPEISHQHHATALEDGRILLYDNGMHRLQDLPFSRVLEVDPETEEIGWTYEGEPRQQFFSGHISGAARLPNGNTLITEGAAGRLFEVTRRGGTVWEWVSPFATHARGEQGNEVFRAWRYAEDHPALAGRELDAGALAGFNRQHGLERRA